MSAPVTRDGVDVLSRFYAVVLNHFAGAGRRVRWSPTHRAWLQSHPYARHGTRPWLASPGETFDLPDAPYEDELTAAITLAHRVTAPSRSPWFCQHCWQTTPAIHFIAPDIHGDPELYCVQTPSFAIVDSSGGSGTVKHWGSPFGCQSVGSSIDSELYGRGEYIGPLAGYVYGRPLPAEEVINRDWCSRCVGTAHNVRTNAATKGESEAEWARERAKRHVTRLGLELAQYYGDE
jgi:hypothetical protein